MPAPTFFQPIEAILNDKCQYEYYNQSTNTFSKENRSRICHVTLPGSGTVNKDIIMMIFTIRNQPSREREYVWKIHSEGIKRMDVGSTVPQRNMAVKLAKQKGWKYMAVAVASEDTPVTDIITQYVVSMESYSYGNNTVYDLTSDLLELDSLENPLFYRSKANINGSTYSLSFIKKEIFIDYLTLFDNRPYSIEQINMELTQPIHAIKYLTPEWFREKAMEYSAIDEEASSLYNDFHDRFSADALKALSGKDLLYKMFYSGDSNKENLCYMLEFQPRIKELFGSISGGSAYKFSLFYQNKLNSWMTGAASKPQTISDDEAIVLGTEIRDCLVNGLGIIESNKGICSKAEYIALYNQLKGCMPKYIDAMWVQKYYHMMYPNMFPVFYNEAWQRHVLCNLSIVPSDEGFVRMGQINVYVNECGISNAVFAKIIYDNLGGVKSFYRIGTGENGQYFDLFKNDGYVAIGWNYLGDLTGLKNENGDLDKDIVVEELIDKEGYDKKTASRKYGEIAAFFSAIINDTYIIAMKGNNVLGIGMLKGDYYFDDTKPYGHCRKVEWLKICDDAKLPNEEGKLTTYYEIDDYENICYLYSLLHNGDDIVIDDEEINEEEVIHMNKRVPRTSSCISLNTILYGAPGTGKTYATAEYAVAIANGREPKVKRLQKADRESLMAEYESLVQQGRVIFTTFHQSYGYEDFIQGLRPDTNANTIKFKPVDGVFKKIADKARKDLVNDYVIIIDEINRGNISKVFGELITLIESDKRWGEENQLCVTLPSGEPFAVPNNLFIVGTMNSADKSISLIDTALRRRFDFEEIRPDASMIDDTTLRSVIEKLNEALEKELDSTDLLVGQAYFMGKAESDLCKIMNKNIIPLLYEYFYDTKKKVKGIIEEAVKGLNYKVDDVACGRLKLEVKG